MSVGQSWRIARLQAENARLFAENRLLASRLEETQELCRSFACSCLRAEGRCGKGGCGSGEWCDYVAFLARPM